MILFALPIEDIEESKNKQQLIKLLGMICLIDAIRSPLLFVQEKYKILLTNHELISDAESLYFRTGISAEIWGWIWFGIGAFGLIVVWIISVRKADHLYFEV